MVFPLFSTDSLECFSCTGYRDVSDQFFIVISQTGQQNFNTFKKKFNELGVEDYAKVTSQTIIYTDQFVEIGIAGANIVKEVPLPVDTHFYNYASFSFDN